MSSSNNYIEKILLSKATLSKIPFTFFILIFVFPILLLKTNYKVGLFFIAFYVSFWVLRALESYIYILFSYIKLLKVNKKDYYNTEIIQKEAKKLHHIIILTIYTEPYSVMEESVNAIIENNYPYKENITIILAPEQRRKDALETAEKILKKFKKSGVKIVSISHPDLLPGEGKVKGANITYAIKKYMKEYSPDEYQTFVSMVDGDTKIEKNFFLIVSYFFLSTEKRDNAIYQYMPIYSNNWNKGTFFARLIGMGTTFWQLAESQNPEFYRNFATYGQSLYCLKKSDFWSKTSIVEDGLQYWRSYFAFDGIFRIVNVPAVCKMDLVEEKTFLKTIKSQYKQLRRWSWGCSDIEFVIPKFYKNKKIPFIEKFRKTGYLLLNHLFWAGGSITIFFIGYIPEFFNTLKNSIVVLTMPLSTSLIFTCLFFTVIFPSILSILIMSKYTKFKKRHYIFNIIQWLIVPILYLTLQSLPAIESQIRYFFNKRIDHFESTEKMPR